MDVVIDLLEKMLKGLQLGERKNKSSGFEKITANQIVLKIHLDRFDGGFFDLPEKDAIEQLYIFEQWFGEINNWM